LRKEKVSNSWLCIRKKKLKFSWHFNSIKKWDFKRWLDHEGSVCMGGITAVTKEQVFPFLFFLNKLSKM
jgi:hypothetical protein